jgi:hypothetical protein
MVTVKVGPEETIFIVAKSVLCGKSTFFECALKSASDFAEAQENVVRLPEEDEAMFNLFLKWVYNECEVPERATSAVVKELVERFNFGDRLGVLNLQKEVVKKLFAVLVHVGKDQTHGKHQSQFLADLVCSVYASEPASAKVLKFMVVDHFVWQVRKTYFVAKDFKSFTDRFPEFARDCMITMGEVAVAEEKVGAKNLKSPFLTCSVI